VAATADAAVLADLVAATCVDIVADLAVGGGKSGSDSSGSSGGDEYGGDGGNDDDQGGGNGGGFGKKHATVQELMEHAESLESFNARALRLAGAADAEAQRLCVDTKLLDALFEAALAPYNRSFQRRPFEGAPPGARAVQVLLFYACRSIVGSCRHAQAYVGRRTSRIWLAELPPLSKSGRRAPRVAHAEGGAHTGEACRRAEKWVNILVLQASDPLGSTELLTDLVRTANVLGSGGAAKFLKLVKELIRTVGPQPRREFLHMFGCF